MISRNSMGVHVIALVAIVAFVIVLLAFFFTAAPIRGLQVMNGAPHGYEEFEGYASYPSHRSERLDLPTRTPYRLPSDIRESGLSEGGNTN